MPTNYQRGRAFEYRTRNALLKQGALYVMRAAQSKGMADLIALFPAARFGYWSALDVRLVQCKLDGRLSKADAEALRHLAMQTGTSAWAAEPGPNNRGVKFTRL